MATFIVAVTGGIASGKSAVTEFFSELGIEIADADIAARDVVAPGQVALEEIIAAFGADIVKDQQLDRQALRQLIFENKAAKQTLEAILHPRIRSRLQAQCEASTSDYVVVAIPLLTEVGAKHAYPWIDKILVVDATRLRQFERLISRDHISPELANKMLDAQASRFQRLAIADDVISNMHDLAALKACVLRLDKHYRELI